MTTWDYVVVGDSSTGKSSLLVQLTDKRFLGRSDPTYRGAVGALLVFDTTYRRSFLNLPRWLEDLRAYGDPDLTVVVVGNKSDLIESAHDSVLASKSRQVSRAEASSWAHERGLDYIETSAKTGLNVEQAFVQVAKKIYDSGRLERHDQVRQSSSFPLIRPNPNDTKNRLNCCGA